MARTGSKYVITNIRFTPEESRKLKFIAQAQNKSLAQVVREAVASYVVGLEGQRLSEQELVGDPFFEVIGLGESGVPDGAEKHDEHIYELRGPVKPANPISRVVSSSEEGIPKA